jgi:hypothetical protein
LYSALRLTHSLALGAAPSGVLRRCDVVSVEVQIALDGEAERAAQFAQFAHANEADELAERYSLKTSLHLQTPSLQLINQQVGVLRSWLVFQK